jgi:hypothetical protein
MVHFPRSKFMKTWFTIDHIDADTHIISEYRVGYGTEMTYS